MKLGIDPTVGKGNALVRVQVLLFAHFRSDVARHSNSLMLYKCTNNYTI